MILLIVSGRTIAILLTCTLITLILVGLFKFRDDLANSHPHRAPVGLGATM